MKETINRGKRLTTERDYIFISYTSEKLLMFRIHKEHKSVIKNNPIKIR
jgi:hypothetical protein